MPATVWPICASVSPAAAAALRSTITSSRGTLAASVVSTSATPAIPAIAVRTWSVALASTSLSAAVTSTESWVLPSPELSWPILISPASVSLPNSSRSWSETFAASASSSSATLKVAVPAPPPPANGFAELPPTVTWYVVTSSRSAMIASTFLAASSVAARLVPTGSSWVTVMLSWPDSSRKFVSRRVESANVPISTAMPISTVVQRRVVANLITGR